MKLYEKIHLIRTVKGLSQEDMAEKLGISANGYGKIERGETDVQWSRVEQIAKALALTVKELVSLDEKISLNLNYICDKNQQNNIMLTFEQSNQIGHESGEYKSILEQKDREINLLQEQVAQLKEIIKLMKDEKSDS